MNDNTSEQRGVGSIGVLAILAGGVIAAATGGVIVAGVQEGGLPLYASGDQPEKIQGSDKCAECHPKEAVAWKATHHHTTFNDMPRSPKAREIADKLGIRRIKNESDCLSCHFTMQGPPASMTDISGISCESCHGAGEDWIDIHSTYADGVTRETETAEQKAARIEAAVAAGMLSPTDLYAVAENCFQCHTAPNERLVNVGGHPAGSDFELVSWSQGEVRHNFNRTDNAHNAMSSAENIRVLYVVGKALDLEYGLRGLARATEGKLYAKAMAQRSARALQHLGQIQEAVATDEVGAMLASVGRSDLKLNNADKLNAAADAIKQAAKDFAANHDGSGLAGLDGLIPGEADWKGTASAGE